MEDTQTIAPETGSPDSGSPMDAAVEYVPQVEGGEMSKGERSIAGMGDEQAPPTPGQEPAPTKTPVQIKAEQDAAALAAKAEQAPDFLNGFFKEDPATKARTFDTDGFIKSVTAQPGDYLKEMFAGAPAGEPVKTPEQLAAEAAAANVQPWEKELQEEQKFETDYQKNVIDIINFAIEAGKRNLTIEQIAYEMSRKPIREFQFNQRRARAEAEAKESQTRQESAKYEPQYRANESIVANEMGGYEKLKDTIFHPKLGGIDIQMAFAMSNPEKANLPPKQRAEALNQWFIRAGSSMPVMRYFQHLTRLRQLHAGMPQISKMMRKDLAAQHANRAKTITARATETALPGGDGELSDLQKYFQNTAP